MIGVLGMLLAATSAEAQTGESYAAVVEDNPAWKFSLQGPPGWKLVLLKRRGPYKGFFGPMDKANDFVPNIGFSSYREARSLKNVIDAEQDEVKKYSASYRQNELVPVELADGLKGMKVDYQAQLPGRKALRQVIYYFQPIPDTVFSVTLTTMSIYQGRYLEEFDSSMKSFRLSKQN